ncbi:MAG: hypothetical protein MZV63_24535 [Marinilabiliales bacterium]|nr:hypothetical protein [Marinilabiliales bacterium]
MQAAMVSSFGLWFASFAESLCDDLHVLSWCCSPGRMPAPGNSSRVWHLPAVDRELTALSAWL